MVGSTTTVTHAAHEAVPPSGFVTVTARGPGAAWGATVTATVSFPAAFRTTEPTVMSGPNETCPPPVTKVAAKLLPRTWTLAARPCRTKAGFVLVTVGRALTVKTVPFVAVPRSRLVTV